jgi:hypothetical protein
MIFGSRFPRQPGVHTNRMGELIGTGLGFVFRDRPHSGARRPNPYQAPWVISRRPLVREISVNRMSYKNASAKQTHD